MVWYRYLGSEEEITSVAERILELTPSQLGIDIESSSNTTIPEVISIALPSPIESLDNYDENILDLEESQLVVYLLHMAKCEVIPIAFKEICESQHIVKIGCDLRGDNHDLQEAFGFKLCPILDLQTIELSWGSRAYSLDQLGEKYLNQRKLVFNHRNANWKDQLTKNQLFYAVNDVYLTLKIYQKMFNRQIPIQSQNEFSLDDDFYKPLVDFLAYSSVFAGKRAPSRKKIINAIINNYAPWRKLHSSESKPLAEKAIDSLLTEKILQTDGINGISWMKKSYELPKMESYEQLVKLFQHIQRVHISPMKNNSLVDALSNSFRVDTPVYARKERTRNAINEMIELKLLEVEGNYLIW
jgi:hypothetical protein